MLYIGRHEHVHLTDIGLNELVAKIDTGAYTSSIHCAEVVEKNGKLICGFINPRNDEASLKKIIFAAYKKRKVKSSNGSTEERFAIKTKIKLGSHVYDIELTLTNRESMKYPLLLGRKFLNGKYVVDVSRKNILSK